MSFKWHNTFSFAVMRERFLQHGHFNVAYHVVHNMQLLKIFWGRQVAYVAMKTKSGSRLNVEYDMICVSTCIEPRISILSNRAATSWWFFRGKESDCKLMLYLTTKYVFENFKGSNFSSVPPLLRLCFLTTNRHSLRIDCREWVIKVV